MAKFRVAGQGAMDWQAQVKTLSGGDWLKISAASGRIGRPVQDVAMVEARVTAGSLAPGDYYGKVEVSAAADNSPQVIVVLLSVVPRGSDPGPEVRPTGLIFIGGPGAKPTIPERGGD